nr:hypothetical protein [Tanacetum cinerariifolium]
MRGLLDFGMWLKYGTTTVLVSECARESDSFTVFFEKHSEIYLTEISVVRELVPSRFYFWGIFDNSVTEFRPPMLERGSYIPWASRFRRYLNQKRENRKWLNKAIDEGPYEFKDFTPFESEPPRAQTEEDLTGYDLELYEAEIEAMNLILISIPNDIYNSVDAYTTAQTIWQRVE